MDEIKSFIFGSRMLEAMKRRASPQHLMDEVGPLPQQHVVTFRGNEVYSDTRIRRTVVDGQLSVTRLDQQGEQETELPLAAGYCAPRSSVTPLSAQALQERPQHESLDHVLGTQLFRSESVFDAFGQPRPKSARHVLYHVLDPNPAENQSAPAASEIGNVAALRSTWLDSRQQQSTSSSAKARSKALARNSANHAKLLAAADAITDDRVIVLETIVKIAQNAHKDAKYRSVKSSSKTLQEKVLRLGGGPLLAAVGFEEHGARWELSSEASAEHLQTLSSLLDAAQKLASAKASNIDRSHSPCVQRAPQP